MSSITEVKPLPTKSIDGDDIPWVPFAPYSDEVFLKYHHINPAQGEILLSMRFPAGRRLPTHYHTGIVIGHTIKGAWRYLEHDWVSRAGAPSTRPPGRRTRPRAAETRRPRSSSSSSASCSSSTPTGTSSRARTISPRWSATSPTAAITGSSRRT